MGFLDRLRGVGAAPFHDFGYWGLGERLRIRRELAGLIDARFLSQHADVVRRFEAQFCSALGHRHAVAMNSGTTALLLALHHAGVGPGDVVLTVGNTWLTTMTVVHELGATLRLVDIDARTGMMDPAAVQAALTPETRAIVPVHLYGSMAPMRELLALASPRGIAVIEDACQAVGALLDGVPAGAWGDAAAFSFHTTKLVGAPCDGGMLVTRRDDWAEPLRRSAVGDWDAGPERVQWRVPSRLPPLAVPFLGARLRGLQARIAQRAEQHRRYHDAFAGQPGLQVLEVPAGVQSSHRNCIVLSPAKAAIEAALRSARLPFDSLYGKSAALLQARGAAGHEALPNTLRLAREHLALPLGRQMDRRVQQRVIDVVRRAHATGAAA